jgi:CBS domain-containing protein
MKVKDVMTTSVASVRQNDSLSEAARLMWDCDCGSVPVKEESGERVIGMITDRDICMAAWSRDRAPSQITVSEAMSRGLYSLGPEDKVSTAETLMRAKQVRRIPVLGLEGELLGILSLADIATESQRGGSDNEVSPRATAETLASISRRRARQEAHATL